MKYQILLLFLVCAIAYVSADRECKLQTGDVFSARYPDSRSTFAGLKVYFVFGGDGKSGMEATHGETVFIEWEIDDDEELAVRDFSSNPGAAGCPKDIIGTYRVDWDFYKSNVTTPSCLKGKLFAIRDECHERRMHYDGLIITKVRKQNTVDCGFYPEQVWKGKYPNNNNVYGGYDVSIVFSSDGESAIEHSDFATFFVEWENINTGSDRSLDSLYVRDFGANPDVNHCGVLEEGQYQLFWDTITCQSVKLQVVADDCIPRREQYNNLVLTRVQDFEPFRHGDDDDAAISLKFSLLSLALSCFLALFFF